MDWYVFIQIWRIRFDHCAQQSSFWEAKNGSRQREKLESKRKKKELAQIKKEKH